MAAKWVTMTTRRQSGESGFWKLKIFIRFLLAPPRNFPLFCRKTEHSFHSLSTLHHKDFNILIIFGSSRSQDHTLLLIISLTFYQSFFRQKSKLSRIYYPKMCSKSWLQNLNKVFKFSVELLTFAGNAIIRCCDPDHDSCLQARLPSPGQGWKRIYWYLGVCLSDDTRR